MIHDEKVTHRWTSLAVLGRSQRGDFELAARDRRVGCLEKVRRITVRELAEVAVVETVHTVAVTEAAAVGRLEAQVIAVVSEPGRDHRVGGKRRYDGSLRRRGSLVDDQ